jgi:hypothetical protein
MSADQLAQAILGRIQCKIIAAKQTPQALKLESGLKAGMPRAALEKAVTGQRSQQPRRRTLGKVKCLRNLSDLQTRPIR